MILQIGTETWQSTKNRKQFSLWFCIDSYSRATIQTIWLLGYGYYLMAKALAIYNVLQRKKKRKKLPWICIPFSRWQRGKPSGITTGSFRRRKWKNHVLLFVLVDVLFLTLKTQWDDRMPLAQFTHLELKLGLSSLSLCRRNDIIRNVMSIRDKLI